MARRKNTDDEPNDNSENMNESDDTFGLPEIEYEPLNRDHDQSEPEATHHVEESTPSYETTSDYNTDSGDLIDERPLEDSSSQYTYSYQQEESSSGGKIALIIILLLALLGAGGYFFYLKPKWAEEDRIAAEREKKNRELALKQQAEKDSLERVENDRKKRIADSLAMVNAQPAEGTIDTLTGRTGRYYVIAASDVDDDLLMDFARKLSKKGVSSKIIPPHGRVKFFRLAIDDGDTFSETQNKANDLKGDYGADLWVVKY